MENTKKVGISIEIRSTISQFPPLQVHGNCKIHHFNSTFLTKIPRFQYTTPRF